MARDNYSYNKYKRELAKKKKKEEKLQRKLDKKNQASGAQDQVSGGPAMPNPEAPLQEGPLNVQDNKVE